MKQTGRNNVHTNIDYSKVAANIWLSSLSLHHRFYLTEDGALLPARIFYCWNILYYIPARRSGRGGWENALEAFLTCWGRISSVYSSSHNITTNMNSFSKESKYLILVNLSDNCRNEIYIYLMSVMTSPGQF